MIQIKFISGPPCIMEIIEGETVREFCIRLMLQNDVRPLHSKTCYYILLQGKLINSLENRFSILSEISDVTKPYYATFASLASPSQLCSVKGNLRTDQFEPDEDCPICMEELFGVPVKGTLYALDCGHRYHMKCLIDSIKHTVSDSRSLANQSCPQCRIRINPGLVSYFYTFSGNV